MKSVEGAWGAFQRPRASLAAPSRLCSWRLRGRAALGALGLSLLASSAQAGLFDDEEARKAIIDLRARITQIEGANKSRVAEVDAAQARRNEEATEQLSVLRRSLLDLNSQIVALRIEIAKLRGTDEELTRGLSDAQKMQRDIAQSLDERMAALEPQKVSIDGKEQLVGRDERRSYDEAVAALRGGDFDKAVTLLANFQRRYAGGPYGDSARFWYGNALYGKRYYKDAIVAFREFVNQAPDHARAPEALLALANSQSETKDPKGAKSTLEELIKAYPQSEAARTARDRLPKIR